MAWHLKLLSLSLVTIFVTSPVAFADPTNNGSPMLLKGHETKPLIKFAKSSMKLGDISLIVELADDSAKQEQGLMFRKKLGLHDGMLFVFKEEQSRAFWMKNTFIDLDIGFFDKNRKLIDIQTMAAMKTVMDENLPTYSSQAPAQYALEVTKGWFAKNKIKLGTTFSLK